MGRLVVLALVAFMTLPTVVVIVASFNSTAILSFPPQGLSLRWYENALTYPQFRRAGDDVDVCWRLQARGWTLGFSAAAMVWHHRRQGDTFQGRDVCVRDIFDVGVGPRPVRANESRKTSRTMIADEPTYQIAFACEAGTVDHTRE